jgi:hypothetical protein
LSFRSQGGNISDIKQKIPQKRHFENCLCLAQPAWLKWNQARAVLISMWQIVIISF